MLFPHPVTPHTTKPNKQHPSFIFPAWRVSFFFKSVRHFSLKGGQRSPFFLERRAAFVLEMRNCFIVTLAAAAAVVVVVLGVCVRGDGDGNRTRDVGCPATFQGTVLEGYCGYKFASGSKVLTPRGMLTLPSGDILMVSQSSSSVVLLVPSHELFAPELILSLVAHTGLNHGIAYSDGFLYASTSTTVYVSPPLLSFFFFLTGLKTKGIDGHMQIIDRRSMQDRSRPWSSRCHAAITLPVH